MKELFPFHENKILQKVRNPLWIGFFPKLKIWTDFYCLDRVICDSTSNFSNFVAIILSMMIEYVD